MTESSNPGTSQSGFLSPIWVGIAIWLFFPLGLFLLWRHPTLGRSSKWWATGIAWACFIMFMGSRAENNEQPERPEDPPTPYTADNEHPNKTPQQSGQRLERGWFESQHAYMLRLAEAILPEVYGGYEMKWGKDFLAGRNASRHGWGGTAALRNGQNLFVSFFPKGSDFVWLTSPSDGGIFAAGYSDTRYWASKGRPIEDVEAFWKRAGLTMAEVMKESKQMAKLNRANEEKKKQRASEKFMRDWNEYKPSR